MKTSNLATDGRPDFENVVIRATDDLVTTELETCNDVIIMSLHYLHQQPHTLLPLLKHTGVSALTTYKKSN